MRGKNQWRIRSATHFQPFRRSERERPRGIFKQPCGFSMLLSVSETEALQAGADLLVTRYCSKLEGWLMQFHKGSGGGGRKRTAAVRTNSHFCWSSNQHSRSNRKA